MTNLYRYDIFSLADEDATNKLLVEGIHVHCSRCSNFIPEIKGDPNKHLIRCVHFTACLETLNREAYNKEEKK